MLQKFNFNLTLIVVALRLDRGWLWRLAAHGVTFYLYRLIPGYYIFILNYVCR